MYGEESSRYTSPTTTKSQGVSELLSASSITNKKQELLKLANDIVR